MKKIFLTVICLALFASENMAQYDNRSGSGNWVDNMRYDAPDLYRSYKAGSTLSSTGMGLTLGGLAVAVIGFATAEKETTSTSSGTQVNLSGSGGAVFAVGTVCALVGTPIWIIGSTKKKNARRAYQREYGDATNAPYLKLHSTANSVGLALVF
ncbi:MAG: hypothetical protein LBQ73_07780 [Tannerellaceae bacterium]|jgi:hypothetical protein|nr:hypothetical protein [Tannerellaceae bacterium]